MDILEGYCYCCEMFLSNCRKNEVLGETDCLNPPTHPTSDNCISLVLKKIGERLINY